MQGNNSDRIEERMPIDLKSLIDFSHISDVGIVTFINYNTAVLETLNGYEFSVDICNSVRSQSGSATFKSLKNEICEKMKGSSGGFDDIKYDMIQRAEMDLKKSHSILKLLTLCKEYASLPKDFFQEFNILILDKDFLTEILKLMNDNTTDETSFKDLKQKLTQKLSEINEHLEDVKNLYNDKIELRELELSRLNDESQEKEEERQNAKEEKFTKEKDKIVARLTSLTKEELFELNTTRNIQQLLDTEIENVRQSANVTKNLLEAQHASEIFRINREKTDIENQLNHEKTLLQIERDQLNLRVDVLRQDIDRIGQENNDKEAQLAQITNNLNHLQQEKDVLDQEIIQINADAQNRIAAANANAQDRIAAANADAKTQIAAANADAKTQIAAANADAQAYKDNEIIRITQAKENEINRIINEKDNEILRITEAKHAAEQKNKTNEVTLLTQTKELQDALETITGLKEEVKTLKERIDIITSENNDNVAQHSEELTRLQTSLNSVTQENKKNITELEEKKVELTQAISDKSLSESEKIKLQESLRDVLFEKNYLNEQNKIFNDEKKKCELKLVNLQRENTEISKKMRVKTVELFAIKSNSERQLQEAKEKLETVDQEAKEAAAEQLKVVTDNLNEEIRKNGEKALEEQIEVARQLKYLEKQITQAKYEIESLGITIKHKDSVIDSLESELAKSKEKYDSTLNKTKKLIEETNKRYKETESRLETSENNVAGKERAIRKIKAKNNEIARKLKLIEYTNNQLTRTVEASSKKLKEKESTHKEIVRRITEENKIKIEESSGKTEEEIEKVRSDAEERIRGAELEIENARLENIKREEEIKTKIESLTNELSVLQNQIITLNDDNTNKDKLIEELNTAKHMLTFDHSNQIQELEKNKKDEIEKIKSENTDSKEDLKKKIKEIEEKSNLERVRFNEEKDRKDIELEDIQKKLEAVVSENKKELIALNQKQYKELADNTTLRNLAIETAKNEAKTEIETMRAETDLKLQKIIDEKEKLKVERETNENLREINETLKKNIEEITEKSEEEINELKKKFEEGTETYNAKMFESQIESLQKIEELKKKIENKDDELKKLKKENDYMTVIDVSRVNAANKSIYDYIKSNKDETMINALNKSLENLTLQQRILFVDGIRNLPTELRDKMISSKSTSDIRMESFRFENLFERNVLKYTNENKFHVLKIGDDTYILEYKEESRSYFSWMGIGGNKTKRTKPKTKRRKSKQNKSKRIKQKKTKKL